jgi:hypothetical protein
MDDESNFSKVAPPLFDGNNYELWAVKMEAYLEALDVWEAIEEDYEVPPLPDNPTMAQLKYHKEKKTKKAKAKSCLFAGVSETVFTRIMTLKTPKAIWDYLKEEYAGDERIRSMQVLNLMREFELQKMKESETIKEYSDKLLSIANKVRLLVTGFTDSRIVENFLVTVPERYEASLACLENTKDLSKITLAEVIHALQAQEQRRLMRQDRMVEGALAAKSQQSNSMKIIQQVVKMLQIITAKERVRRKVTHLVNTAEKWVTHHLNVGEGQMQSAASAMKWVMKM